MSMISGPISSYEHNLKVYGDKYPTPDFIDGDIFYYLSQDDYHKAIGVSFVRFESCTNIVWLTSDKVIIDLTNKSIKKRRKERQEEKQMQLHKNPIATTFKKIAELSALIAILPVAWLGLIFKK